MHASRAEGYGTTATPMLLQLPITLIATLSNDTVFLRCSSVALSLAISYTCLTLSVPAIAPPGFPASPDPVVIPAACLMRYAVGGVFVIKVKVRSGWIVMRTGVGVPGVRWAVRAGVRRRGFSWGMRRVG